MNDHRPGTGSTPMNRFMGRTVATIDGLCRRIGASRRQFAVFASLLLVASVFWARPGAMLLWNRVRIITGMPRMAVANEDPEVLASNEADPPESLDAGRWVTLDDTLRRDPFESFGAGETTDQLVGSKSNPGKTTQEKNIEWLSSTASLIRLSGTSKGLGTAVLDGRARALGKTFEAHGASFRLAEVRSGAVVLEVRAEGDDSGAFFLLDRSEAVLTNAP